MVSGNRQNVVWFGLSATHALGPGLPQPLLNLTLLLLRSWAVPLTAAWSPFTRGRNAHARRLKKPGKGKLSNQPPRSGLFPHPDLASSWCPRITWRAH